MASFYNPKDWYWAGDPVGRTSNVRGTIIYSTKAKALVSGVPEEWSQRYGEPYPWPKDETNTVSVKGMDDLLELYGFPVTGLADKKD